MSETPPLPTSFILKNWGAFAAFCGVLFALGQIYSEVKETRTENAALKVAFEEHKKDADREHAQIQEKQERKWGDIEEMEQRLDDQEELRSYDEGYRQALKDMKK